MWVFQRLMIVALFAGFTVMTASARGAEGGMSDEEIQAKEIEANKAYGQKEYVKVFEIIKELHEKGVKVMERVAGRGLLKKALIAVFRLKDRKEKIKGQEAFLALPFETEKSWIPETGYGLVRDYCVEKIHLDKVVDLGEKFMRLYEDQLKDLSAERPEDRIKILDRERYRGMLALAYHTAGNYDSKKNPFFKSGKRIKINKFKEMTASAGLGGIPGFRVSFADINADGKEDLIIDGCKVFKNKGGFAFEDISESTGLPEGRGGLFADLNNNRCLDLFQLGKDADRIFLNDGFGKFVEKKDAGFQASAFFTGSAVFADLNRDGLVDLYVARANDLSSKTLRIGPDVLYVNRGKGVFEDGSAKAGIQDGTSMIGGSATACDFDDDGDTDLYVANHNYNFDQNFLWRSDGKGCLADIGKATGAAGTPREYNGKTYHGHSRCAVFGDVNGDGRMDIFAGAICQPKHYDIVGPSQLLILTGDKAAPVFEDRYASAGITFNQLVTDCSLADIDNDGDLDLFTTSQGETLPTFLYRNEGGGKFVNAAWQARTIMFNAYGHAWCDVDKDGDLDLCIASQDGVKLFKNNQGRKNAWLELVLTGRKSNSSAIGARVSARVNGRVYVREVTCGRGATCQDSLTVHFGFGKFKGSADVEIRWPSGKVQRENLAVNQRHSLRE